MKPSEKARIAAELLEVMEETVPFAPMTRGRTVKNLTDLRNALEGVDKHILRHVASFRGLTYRIDPKTPKEQLITILIDDVKDAAKSEVA